MASSLEGFQVIGLGAYSSLDTSYRRLTPSAFTKAFSGVTGVLPSTSPVPYVRGLRLCGG